MRLPAGTCSAAAALLVTLLAAAAPTPSSSFSAAPRAILRRHGPGLNRRRQIHHDGQETPALRAAAGFSPGEGGGGIVEIIESVESSSGPLGVVLDALLSESTFWSVAIMLTIVSLLVGWEESIKTLRRTLPEPLFPVVDSMLAEIGGLGFIGLFLSVFVTGGPGGSIVGELSERFLGEEEILLEAFEFLHTFFFEVGIAFFVVSGIIVASVLRRIQQLGMISELALDTDGDGEVSLDELANALNVPAVVVDADGDGFLSPEEITDALRSMAKNDARTILSEIGMTTAERAGEILLIRERLIQRLKLPKYFLVEEYFEQIFAHDLEEIVELSPQTWLPLIPLIALLDSVDLSREVISASSSNAFESCGCFLGTWWVVIPCAIFHFFGLAWCIVNFWKMAAIKQMILPTLVRDGSPTGLARFLPPRYEDKKLRMSFFPSPGILGPIERVLRSEPGRNPHERLFGAAGAAGPSLYRDSIKFHTWLCVAEIVFFFGQIVARDAWALFLINSGEVVEVGEPANLLPELLLYGFFVVSSMAQLRLTPTVFLNYCTVTSVEGLMRGWAIVKAKRISQESHLKDIKDGRVQTTTTGTMAAGSTGS